MKNDPIEELQKIEAIDEKLAKNLVAEEIDSVDKIVVAGEDGLKRVEGFDSPLVETVLEEAAIMTGRIQRAKQTSAAQVEEKVSEFRSDLQDFIDEMRVRYADKLDKDKVQAFLRESKRIVTALEKIEENLSDYLGEIHKSLEEAEEKISELAESKIRESTRGLKKTRKRLKRMIE